MSVIALDIGGANLKIADGRGYAACDPFALWKSPGDLADRLRVLLAASPPHGEIAVTMTGELCDCFATKTEGVTAILAAVEEAARKLPVRVYLIDGRLVPLGEARAAPMLAAASNWHALAAFACRFVAGAPALLFDLGSTTADVIPLGAEGPKPRGRTDPERLAAGELVYTGVERTPVCAIVSALPCRGRPTPIAAEFFATAGDAHRWLGYLPEEPDNFDAADGRPRTRAASHARLARTVCADVTTFSEKDATAAAEAIVEAQLALLAASLRQVSLAMPKPPKTVILSGQGEWLARRALARMETEAAVISLAEKLGAKASQCAPAHALAVLARERRMEP